MVDARILHLVSQLAQAESRGAAARALAQALGAEDLVLFLIDPEVETLLPAPGFQQTLPRAREWHQFLSLCAEKPYTCGNVFFPDEQHQVAAMGIRGKDGSVMVLIGGDPRPEVAGEVALLLPLISAALGAERLTRAAESQAILAQQAARQSQLLAAPLDRARSSLRKALTDAEAANKAKDAFLAALSHELRTPLNPVLMTATAMELDPELPLEAREQAAIIRRNAELEARLIDDLLDLTRITHGKLVLVPTTVDIHTLLHETRAIVSGEMGDKRITIEFQGEAGERHVHGDPTRLQQVFWNVIKNAIKFTPTGGLIRVVTSNETPGRISIRITDSGIGIDPDALRKIFDAFDQGNISTHRFGGLGLGLAITKALVELHAGTIRAESQGKGHGATFTVELGTVPAPAVAKNASAMPVSPIPAGQLRVLLVEDHDSTRDVLARILRRAGYDVDVAGSSQEARQRAASMKHFDVVISDIGLPDESGLDLMRSLRADHGLTGIALSGYGMEEDIKNAKDAGFSAHLVKPVNFARLREVLEQIAAGALS